MEKVLGIGGLFFRSRDPEALTQWYETHLGIDCVPRAYDGICWTQEAGHTVFAPFSQDTKYFGRPEQQFMVNFRVRDLKAMAAQLEASGIKVELDPEHYPNGWFGRLDDPEDNPIQLWEEEEMPKTTPV